MKVTASGGIQLVDLGKNVVQGNVTKQVVQMSNTNRKSGSNHLNTIGLASGSRTIENMVSSTELTSLHITAQPKLGGPP